MTLNLKYFYLIRTVDSGWFTKTNNILNSSFLLLGDTLETSLSRGIATCNPVLDFLVISYKLWDVVVWKILAEIFLCKYEGSFIFSVLLWSGRFMWLDIFRDLFSSAVEGIGGCAGALVPGWRSLCVCLKHLLLVFILQVMRWDRLVKWTGQGWVWCVCQLHCLMCEMLKKLCWGDHIRLCLQGVEIYPGWPRAGSAVIQLWIQQLLEKCAQFLGTSPSPALCCHHCAFVCSNSDWSE